MARWIFSHKTDRCKSALSYSVGKRTGVKRRMRITFITPQADMSGGIKVIAIYAESLQRKGHDVCIISQPAMAPPVSVRLKSWLGRIGWPAPKAVGVSHFDGRGLDHRVLDRRRPVVDRDVPSADIVVATWWTTAEWVNALHPEKGAKVYFIQHHEIFSYLPVERSRATYRLPLKKVVISRWLKELMSAEYDDDEAALIPNSVEVRQFFAPVRRKQEIPTIGLLYSTVGFKGLPVTLAALEKVRLQLGRVKGIAFGSEPISKPALPSWIEFRHLPRQDEIRLLYSACDVWVCGSYSEGFHLPPLEAMACRCPVVSTRVGGPMDIIQNGVNGFLVDVGDSDKLSERLIDVLQLDDREWLKMSDAALETTLGYTWDDATVLLEAVFRGAISTQELILPHRQVGRS
jgi:glycosyltransferase involved in cell wall biosynthesis